LTIILLWTIKDDHTVYSVLLILLFFILAGIPPFSMFVAKIWFIKIAGPASWLVLIFIMSWIINSIAYLKFIFKNI
jgi:NADH:ubiquinone oxidoreductase subunit 2 (subunit N)